MILLALGAGGFFAGTYGSLIGAGGGFIIVPLLLFLFPAESPAVIVAISLFAVLFTCTSATTAYSRLKRIDYKMGILLALATLPGAVLGVYLLSYMPRAVFQGVMAVLLIGVSIYLLTRPRSVEQGPQAPVASGDQRTLVDSQGTVYTYPVKRLLGSSVCLSTGFMSSMLGMGGGILQVPLFVYMLDIPIQVATATSQFIITTTALTGTLTHLFVGNLGSDWVKLVVLTASVVAGAQVGARLSTRFSATNLARLLSFGLAVVGIRLLMSLW